MMDKSGGFTKAELSEELYDLRQRANKYEQALRMIAEMPGHNVSAQRVWDIARAALDKPGTEVEP